MQERVKPPFRADHVGSLIRPDALIARASGAEKGEMPPAELTHASSTPRSATWCACRRRSGSRSSPTASTTAIPGIATSCCKFANVKPMPSKLTVRFHTADGDRDHSAAVAAGYRQARASQAAFSSTTSSSWSRSRKATPKITIPSPTVMHFRGGREAIDAKAYPDMAEFYDDLARRLSRGDRRPRRSRLPLSADRRGQSRLSVRSGAAPAGAPISARTRRRCRRPTPSCSTTRSRGQPADMTVCMHLCRGNFAGAWVAEGGYEPIAESAVQRDRRRRLFPRIRQRARRRLRAAALPAQGQDRGARPGHHQEPAAWRPRTS